MADTEKKYSLLVATSMGLRLTPVDSQPFHCSDTFGGRAVQPTLAILLNLIVRPHILLSNDFSNHLITISGLGNFVK